MMKKFWVNDNQTAIEAAFNVWSRQFFPQGRGSQDHETYPKIKMQYLKDLHSKTLAYVYQYATSYDEDHADNGFLHTDDVTVNDNYFSQKELHRIVRFYVGLLVPRLPKRHVNAIARLIDLEMTDSHHHSQGSGTSIYTFNARSINLARVVAITQAYLQINGIYRSK